MAKKVKMSINEYGDFHKILTESFKFPMKWKTVQTFKAYVDSCEELIKAKSEELKIEERVRENSLLIQKEIDKIYQLESMKKENKGLSPEKLSEKVNKLASESAPAKEEKKIADEFIYSEIEFPVMDYVVDENLPGQLNVYLSTCKFVNFKLK